MARFKKSKHSLPNWVKQLPDGELKKLHDSYVELAAYNSAMAALTLKEIKGRGKSETKQNAI